MAMSLNLKPHKVAIFLGLIAVLFALQSLFAEYVLFNILDRTSTAPARLLDIFSVNIEESLPTWYSSINLFLASALLAWIALTKRMRNEPYSRYWTGLALIFLYLSMDEGSAIHESTSGPLQRAFDSSGFFEFGWLILGIPLVVLFGLLYFRFWWRLPKRTRNLFAVAAALYVGGAIVIEGISANQYFLDGGSTFRYLAIATVEELFEMLGVVVFIYALLDYQFERDNRLLFQTQTTQPEFSEYRLSWPYSLKRTAIVFGIILLLVNGGLMTWGIALNERQTAAPTQEVAPYHYYILVDQLAGEGVNITHFTGVFSPVDEYAKRTAAALLSGFPSVEILSLPTLNASIAVASDAPLLTGDLILDLMDWIDETEYIYYDTAIIRAIVELTPALPEE